MWEFFLRHSVLRTLKFTHLSLVDQWTQATGCVSPMQFCLVLPPSSFYSCTQVKLSTSDISFAKSVLHVLFRSPFPLWPRDVYHYSACLTLQKFSTKKRLMLGIMPYILYSLSESHKSCTVLRIGKWVSTISTTITKDNRYNISGGLLMWRATYN